MITDLFAGLESVRARLRSHGGDVEVVNITECGEVDIAFIGACHGCPALAFTYAAVVRPALLAVPGVSEVRSHQVNISPVLARRLQKVMDGSFRI